MSAGAKRILDKAATLADLLAIPEEVRRHELIAGEIVEKGAATVRHGRAQANVVTSLNVPFGRRPPGGPLGRPGGWIFATEVDVYFDPQNTLRPDVAGWRRERLPALPEEVPIRVLPDWVCEVLSTNRRDDLVRKKRVYHGHRIPHYWLLDPVEETLLVYRWSADGYIDVLSAQRGERARAEPFDAIELPVGVFFGEDEEDPI